MQYAALSAAQEQWTQGLTRAQRSSGSSHFSTRRCAFKFPLCGIWLALSVALAQGKGVGECVIQIHAWCVNELLGACVGCCMVPDQEMGFDQSRLVLASSRVMRDLCGRCACSCSQRHGECEGKLMLALPHDRRCRLPSSRVILLQLGAH